MWRYIGNSWIVGIPARDIGKEEFDQMSKTDQQIIKSCGLYQFEKQSAKSAQEKS